MRFPATRTVLLLGASLVGWMALAFAGFPSPTIDDLFYAGPAVHLAAGAGLVNPWLGTLDSVGHRFFIYPPLYFPILAGWLKLWGVGTFALLSFQVLAAFGATLVGYLFLRRIPGMGIGLLFVGQLLLLTLVGLSGLRPDLCALALFALGAWLETMASDKALPRFLGAFLLIASVQTLPFLVVWVALFVLWRLVTVPAEKKKGLLLRFGLALAVNLTLFLWAIDFQSAAFFHDLSVCEANHSYANRNFYAATWHSPSSLLRTLLLPLCFLGSGALLLTGKWKRATLPEERQRIARTALFLSLLIGLSLFFVTRSVSAVRFLGLQCTLGTALFAALGMREQPYFAKKLPLLLAAVIACLTFVVSYGRGLPEGFLADPPDAARLAVLRQTAATIQAENVIVDSVSARLVFDYRLPPGAKDATWDFSWDHPPLGPVPQPHTGRTLEILSPQGFIYRPMSNAYPPDAAPVPIRLFGRTLPRTAANRNAIFMIAH